MNISINNIFNIVISSFAFVIVLNSCSLEEIYYSEVTPDTFIKDKNSVNAILSRPFAQLSDYVGWERWYLQELTTDEMVCPQRGADWYNGGEYFRLHYHTWNPDDRFIVNTYNSTMSNISMILEAKSDLENVDYESIGLTEELKQNHLLQLDVLEMHFLKKGLDYFGGLPIYESNNDDLKPRSTDKETFEYIEKTLLEAIPGLTKKTELGAGEYGEINQAVTASLLAQLYFNAEFYCGESRFDDCAKICQDIIDGVYGKYELDNTWWGPHGFDNNLSPEIIWSLPSEKNKQEWSWYYKYFYHYNSFKYFNIETSGYNGFILTPSHKPTGEIYSEYRLGNTFEKFHKDDLRKKPYVYKGNKQYEGMFLIGKQINPNDSTMVCVGQKEYKDQVINFVDQVARFSEVGSKYNSISELPSTMADGEENSGLRLVKSPQPTINDINIRYNPDCPIIRLAEIYYMLAECKLRKGEKSEAAKLINMVRCRNFEGKVDPDPVTSNNLDEYRMLDEWMIEFLGEARRRTDLIRWNKFTTDKWWDHVPSNDKNKNRFPIPSAAISANNLIIQNPGY